MRLVEAGEGTGEPAGSLRRALRRSRENALWIVAAGLVLTVVSLHYLDLAGVPPGYFSDEASVSYDAQGIATDLRDVHGAFLPVVFQSFGTWRASLLIYLVAAVFRVAGPGVVQARAVSTTVALLTATFLAILVWRLFGARWLALGAFAVAGLTPWLFTTGRLAHESVTLPAVLAGFLLLWHVADRMERPAWGLAAGLALGLSVYTYISAWLFAPLLCAALVIAELPRIRWGLLVATSVGVELAVLPLVWFVVTHPGALTARYQAVQVWLPGHPLLENLGRVWRVYSSGLSPDYLFQRTFFIQGGEFFALLAPALVVGLVALWRVRGQRFWRLVLLGLLLAPVPAALTVDFSHDLRNLEGAPFHLLLMALGTWTLAPLLTRQRLVAAGLAGLLAFQAVWFLADYYTRVPGRMSGWQTAGYQEAVLESIRIAHGGPILLEPDLFSAETYDAVPSEIAFAFFAGEDVRDYRRRGIGALNASVGQPAPGAAGTLVIALGDRPVPGARLVESIRITNPDDWGQPQSTVAYQIWRE